MIENTALQNDSTGITSATEPIEKRSYKLFALIYSAAGIAALLTTSLVDYALNGTFTWSLLSTVSILYTLLCVSPLLLAKTQSPDAALLSASIFLIPFLWALCTLLGGDWFMTLGISSAISGIVLVWILRGIFATNLTVWDKYAVAAIVLALATVALAFALEPLLHDGGFDIWDMLAVTVLGFSAVVLFIIGRVFGKR